jgi:hypothetical protein
MKTGQNDIVPFWDKRLKKCSILGQSLFSAIEKIRIDAEYIRHPVQPIYQVCQRRSENVPNWAV